MRVIEKLVTLALGCAVAACEGGDDTGAAGSGGAPDPVTTARTVTLLTGHRVTVFGQDRIAVEPPAGGGRSEVQMYRRAGHDFVVPLEAAAVVAGGLLDERLFDVTELIELDYDDAHRADLPLIVTYLAGARIAASTTAANAALTAAGAVVTRPLVSIEGAAMRAPKQAGAFWSALSGGGPATVTATALPGVRKIWLDGKRRLYLDRSVPQVGAPAASAAGFTGAGVTVAVLDTGIAAGHADFAGRIAEARSFIDGVTEATDDVGHGTHVASIIAGTGAAEGGRFRGVAPAAQLLVGKVCDLDGCPSSSILAGMEWAAERGAAVVNLSLGGPDSPEVDPLEEAINTLTAAHGTLFVVAAGNYGACGGMDFLEVASPSTADAALSVGAVDSDNQLADFSCRGPRVGDSAIKPDVTAPGVGIVAARAVGTPVGDSDPVGDHYTRLSGTSMATPHVAGAAAILAQQHPDWKAPELKSALMASALPHAELTAFEQGAGRLDVARAITQTVIASPASVSLGKPLWPHTDDAPIVRTVTYHNRGPAAVSLRLAYEVGAPGGGTAPAGMFVVAPTSIAVPAGGQRQVTVTVDTRIAGPDGPYSGALVAAAGTHQVRVPIAVDKEVESYDVELVNAFRDGEPVVAVTNLYRADNGDELGPFYVLTDPIELRLPRGTYHVDSTVSGTDRDQRAYTAMFVQPALEVDRPRTVTFDARQAQPVAITVPRASARRAGESISYTRRFTDSADAISSLLVFFPDRKTPPHTFYTAHLGPAVPEADLVTTIQNTWAEPTADGGFVDSPYAYHVAVVPERGRFPTGLTRAVHASDLATMRTVSAAQAPDFKGQLTRTAFPDGAHVGLAASLPFRLPQVRTDHLTDGVRWSVVFAELGPNGSLQSVLQPLAPTTIERGHTYHARWNVAVLGPSLGLPEGLRPWVSRLGDDLLVLAPPLLTDDPAHYPFAGTGSGATRLFRDGALIGATALPAIGRFTVPAAGGTYRLEVDRVRAGLSRLSTQVKLAWSFRSAGLATGERVALPVMAVRYSPPLDHHNAAPAGCHYVVPFVVSRQPGARAARLSGLTVEASYDAGRTWRPARVIRFGGAGMALVRHPKQGGGTVSLRAAVADRDGNTVEQTILDAYHLRDR